MLCIPRSVLPAAVFSATLCFAVGAFAQASSSACGTPPAILQSTVPNIFSEQQEQWLGEAMADQVDRDYRPIKNVALNAYVRTIGDRLLAVLPPTKIDFHYTLVDSSEINGFSLAGGRVYLTSKLVASARTEDEIAGVVAHEMGHILSHQFAIETTADLRKLLGVTSVGDRADVYAKFERLVDARMHQKHQTNSDSDDKQDQADRVAVYAAAAAGYRPQAYADFWDRSFFVGGKTGSHITDFFGVTTTSQKRLRRIRGIIAELPSGCGPADEMAASPDFQHWQHDVLENQAARSETAGTISGISAVQLSPPLRMDIDRLRFSRDGKYILAQDESSIFVLTHDPFKELFRFDAEGALPADFTPDSQQIAFTTQGLHVELWSISEKKLVSAHEIVAQHDCFQVHLSPDAHTLVCASGAGENEIAISLIDVATGHVVFEKQPWFHPNLNFDLALLFHQFTNDREDVLTSSLSADGNTFLIGPGTDRLAFDLRTRSPIKLEGALKSSDYPTSYCFQGNDKIVAVGRDPDNSGIFSFPDGKRLKKMKLSLPYMHATTGADLVITSGPPDSAVAVGDVSTGKYRFASRTFAVDVFGTDVVDENLDGSLVRAKLGSMDKKEMARASLSLSPLTRASAVSLSPDARYLAFSARTRGTIWDLSTGKQVMLVRGFRYPWWSSKGKLLAEFAALDKDHPRSMAELDMASRLNHRFSYKLPDKAHLESGHLLEWKVENKKNTLTASSPVDLSLEWTRAFSEGRPNYTTNQADTDLIFSYELTSALAKDRLRANPGLKTQADAIKQKAAGRLIEIINSADGTVRTSTVVEIPLSYRTVDGFSRVGDLLYLSTGDNRTVVYSMKTGAQLRQIFGTLVSADAASGNICISNRRGEVLVFDSAGGELQHTALASPIRFAELRDHGTNLIVVTADQRLHRFTFATPLAGSVTPTKPSP